MTYLFDPGKAMAVLEDYERQWGGNVQQRMKAKYDAYAAQFATTARPAPDEQQASEEVEADNKPAAEPSVAQTDAAAPAPEPEATPAAVAAPSPSAPAAPAPQGQ